METKTSLRERLNNGISRHLSAVHGEVWWTLTQPGFACISSANLAHVESALKFLTDALLVTTVEPAEFDAEYSEYFATVRYA